MITCHQPLIKFPLWLLYRIEQRKVPIFCIKLNLNFPAITNLEKLDCRLQMLTFSVARIFCCCLPLCVIRIHACIVHTFYMYQNFFPASNHVFVWSSAPSLYSWFLIPDSRFSIPDFINSNILIFLEKVLLSLHMICPYKISMIYARNQIFFLENRIGNKTII